MNKEKEALIARERFIAERGFWKGVDFAFEYFSDKLAEGIPLSDCVKADIEGLHKYIDETRL